VHYISKPAVLKTLSAIKACAPSGSELVFDYAVHESHQGHQDRKTVENLKKYTQRRGEPIVSTFDPESFPREVESLGYVLMENLSPREQAERYFKENNGMEVVMPGSYFAHFRIL
jgi:O-methyltransferase involved in polyketide biosynthesis